MTVTLKKTGSDNIILCDGADYAGVVGKFVGPAGDASTEVAWDVVPRKYIGAATARPKALGNAIHSFTLGVWIVYATEAEATAFRLSWAATLYYDGATLEAVGGAKTVTYAPAAIKTCRIVQIGVGCTVDYEFVCGAPALT